MKIVAVDTFLIGTPPPFKGGINWGFVKVMTDEGIVGWGELSGAALRGRFEPVGPVIKDLVTKLKITAN